MSPAVVGVFTNNHFGLAYGNSLYFFRCGAFALMCGFASLLPSAVVGENTNNGGRRENWLVKNGNINASRISVHPAGEVKPTASSETAKGRQQNRRVEIAVRTS